ncbi:MAG: hypothetical protein JSW28_01315 [Thermoplasmata archaeon]|nr:MAG: hypothetical protein JSW28_01315 [Thermoplasmata archaeon]
MVPFKTVSDVKKERDNPLLKKSAPSIKGEGLTASKDFDETFLKSFGAIVNFV